MRLALKAMDRRRALIKAIKGKGSRALEKTSVPTTPGAGSTFDGCRLSLVCADNNQSKSQ